MNRVNWNEPVFASDIMVALLIEMLIKEANHERPDSVNI